MADLRINGIGGARLGNSLQDFLTAQDIQPGDAPSYQVCKTIYAYHPLGAKMAEAPVSMAQSQSRDIEIPAGPQEDLKEAFLKEWRAIGADAQIFNTMTLSRVYGIASIAMLVDGVRSNDPVDYEKLADAKISFNVFDPLNTAGSLVLNQNPNDMDFLKTTTIRVQGDIYHRSRTCVMLNEQPIYLEYTTSAFGYVGRSVYQRALFPLKSFVNSMITDDMVVKKAGLLIAMLKNAGSIVDRVMAAVAGVKRQLLKEAETNNVLSIDVDEKIETLDLQNLDGAYGMARKNILENIAVSEDMPAKLLNSETFAEGFGEGTEDAKHIAGYIERFREKMAPIYAYFDKIVQYRAWNENFYKTIQARYPKEYGNTPYAVAFQEWRNAFIATWPSLLREPESELIKVDEVKLEAVIALIETLKPGLDPDNRATLIQWGADTFNDLKRLFPTPLQLDYVALAAYDPMDEAEGDNAGDQPNQPRPFKAIPDSQGRADEAVRRLSAAVSRLPERRAPQRRSA